MNYTIYAKYFGTNAKYPLDGKQNELSYKSGDIHGAWKWESKYCNDGHSWNLFKNSGEFITVSVSLGFSEHLYSCEYFGATGYDEWVTANDGVKQFNNLLKIRQWCPLGGHEVQMIPPPVFFSWNWLSVVCNIRRKQGAIQEQKWCKMPNRIYS